MINLKYSNRIGNVYFSGSDRSCVHIITITGLGLPKKNYKTIEFASENGVTQTSEKDMARTITITAEVTGGMRDCRHISKVLHERGNLYITSGNLRRRIECKCVQPPEFKRLSVGVDIYTFTLQLQADYPYYTDYYDIHHPIFKLQNAVTNEFTLPCVFTKRLSRSEVFNSGDKRVYSNIFIKNLGTASMFQSETSIRIINHTTGAEIVINHNMLTNESININFADRKIESSIEGNITHKLDDNSILSDFYLDVGKNDIEFINGNEDNQNLSAIMTYSPEYFSVEV